MATKATVKIPAVVYLSSGHRMLAQFGLSNVCACENTKVVHCLVTSIISFQAKHEGNCLQNTKKGAAGAQRNNLPGLLSQATRTSTKRKKHVPLKSLISSGSI